MTRLPAVGGDKGKWGEILNAFLLVEHNLDGTLKSSGTIGTRAPLNNPVFTGSVTIPDPIAATDAVTKSYVDGMLANLELPTGGSQGEVLTKATLADYDTTWSPINFPVTSINGKFGEVVLDADDINDSLASNKFMTASEKVKLSGIQAGAEVNTKADWNATVGDSEILNKPILSPVATSGNYNDLSNTPSIPTVSADIGAVANVQNVTGIWRGTESEYNSLVTPDPSTLYIVVADE